MVTKNLYTQAASHALGGFQMLEKHLKDYITSHHKVIAAHLPKDLPYRFTGREVADAPLGKLISAFEPRTANEKLVASLRKLAPKRNELAHRSLSMTYGEHLSSQELQAQSNKFVQLAKDIAEVMGQLQSEHRALSDVYGRAIDSMHTLGASSVQAADTNNSDDTSGAA
jgi:hypothetical protein